MQINRNAFCLIATLGILLLANESFARAQKPPGGASSSGSNSTAQNSTGSSNGGKKYSFTFGGVTKTYTVAELEALGPIKNGDGTVWMNGPGTFPGVKRGESISLQNFFNNTPTANTPAVEAVNNAAAVGATTAAPAALPADAQAFAAAPAAPQPAAAKPPQALQLNENGELCFSTIAEYNSIKDKLPLKLRQLPMTLGGVFSDGMVKKGAIKVFELNGKIRVDFAVLAEIFLIGKKPFVGQENLKKVCFKGQTANMELENNEKIALDFTAAESVTVNMKGQTIPFPYSNESTYASITQEVNSLAKPVPPASVGVQ